MIVLTVDQRGSRRHGDRVPAVLARLHERTRGRDGLLVPFDRTVGDEVQAVLTDPTLAVDLALDLLRDGGWSVGIGLGPVDHPLPAASREASGPAFVHARDAVERAKTKGLAVPLAVDAGPDPEPADAARDAEAVLRLLGAVAARRTDAGWEAVDTLARVGGSQKDVARTLGVSDQAVSQRLRAGLWAEEVAARPAAARLLALADDGGQGERGGRGRQGGG